MPDDITPIRRQPCPHCGAEADSAGTTDGKPQPPPSSGDYLVCLYCAQPAVYDVGPFGVTLRLPNPEELAEFAVDHGHHAAKIRHFLAQENHKK